LILSRISLTRGSLAMVVRARSGFLSTNACTALCSIGIARFAISLNLSVGNSKGDRKSTRLNSSHLVISYAVFCLKKKKKDQTHGEIHMIVLFTFFCSGWPLVDHLFFALQLLFVCLIACIF